jgi:hypothetical protein
MFSHYGLQNINSGKAKVYEEQVYCFASILDKKHHGTVTCDRLFCLVATTYS